ncbi:MAG: S8 family serine peptidase, partial [Nanoarchaeota archaeon]|nr:S8 family serine peptidase [Nanoarchaeota archaeon]
MKIAYLFLCFILSFTFTYAQSLEDFEEISEDVLELLESNTSSVDLILVEKETLFEKSMQSIGVYKKAKLLKDKSIKFKGNKKELEKELAKGKISKVYVDYSYTSELDEVKEIIHYNEVSTNLALSGNGIKIAILDTGSYGTVTYEEDFSGSQTTTDIFGHGKYVQTIVSSFAPNAQIYSLKVLGDTGSGTGSSIYAGIMKAVELDVDIIQMSLGVAIANDPYVQTALEYAREEGVILVASAGNCGSGACGSFTGVTFPANSDEVLAVSSVDKQGVRSSFSSTGSELNYSMIGEDLMVLGSSISGTSFAAPQLSGTLALLLEHSEDESSLYAGAVDLGDAGFDNEYGNGLVDLAKLFDLEGENPLELEDENFSFINIELANTQYAFLLLTNGSDFAQAAHHYYFENDDEFTVYEQSFSSYYELVHYMQSYYSSSLSSASGDFLTLDGKDYWYYENSLFFSQSSLGESETEELLSFFPKEDWSTFLHNTSSFVSSSLSQSYDENGNPVYAAQYGAGTWQEAQNAPFPYPSNFYHLSFGESNRESYYTQYADNWYYVSTDLNGYLEFTIVDIDSGDDLDLYVYDYQGNKNRLCSSTKGSNLDESCTITKNNNNLWGFYVKVVPYGLSGLSAKGTIELIHHPSSCATGFISNTNFCEAGTYLYADWQNADCSIEEKLKADCDDGFPKYTSWGAEYCRSSTGDIEKRRSKELSACSSSSAACISWTTSEYSTVESCSYGCDTASDSCYECTQDSHCSSGEVCSSHSCVLSAVQVTCYKDKDEDSYGDSNSPHTFTDSCSSYGGYSYVSNALDCDDNDDQLTPQTDWFLDADYDGYTPDLTSATVRNRCTRPSSKYKLWEELSSHSKADCDDANAQISPISDWYRDTDGDSYAYNPSTPQIFNTCTRPFGYKLASEIESTADCDDTQYSTSNSCESNSGDDLCSGTFQVITETSTGAGLEGIIIHENANSQIQVTDSFGQVSFHYTDIGCFEDIEFRAYCPDQRLCQYETQSIRDSFNSLVFDCSMCV